MIVCGTKELFQVEDGAAQQYWAIKSTKWERPHEVKDTTVQCDTERKDKVHDSFLH